jgi:hypothetical protein
MAFINYININNKNVDIKLNPQDSFPGQPSVGTLLVKRLERQIKSTGFVSRTTFSRYTISQKIGKTN